MTRRPRSSARRHVGEALRGRWTGAAIGLAVSATLLAVRPAGAQTNGRGFLFHPPIGSLTLRGGFAHPTASSDVFSFVQDTLTLGRGAFSGITGGLDLAFRVAPQVDVVLGTEYSGRSPRSEFRHWLDNNNQPIQQTTDFQRLPITAGVKAYLAPRGRSISRFAWIPSKAAPFLSGGGGVMWYRFRQHGDFVDFSTRDVFTDTFQASGWTPTAYGAAGIDYSLGPRFLLTGEARYTWARGDLGSDFEGFNRIDLAGLAATVGIGVRF